MALPNIVTDDVVEARAFVSDPQQLSINVLHYLCTAHTAVGITLAEFALKFSIQIENEYKNIIPIPVTFYGVGARSMRSSPRSIEVFDGTDRGPGLLGTTVMAKQVCGLIRKRTDLAGPGGRGHVYVPFPATGVTGGDGRPQAIYLTPLNALAVALQQTLIMTGAGGSATMVPCLYRRTPTPLGTATIVTEMDGIPLWATQRRRGDFGRTNALPF
jgi:hypothetical protein